MMGSGDCLVGKRVVSEFGTRLSIHVKDRERLLLAGFPEDSLPLEQGRAYLESPWPGISTADFVVDGARSLPEALLNEQGGLPFLDLLLTVYRRGREILDQRREAESVLRALNR